MSEEVEVVSRNRVFHIRCLVSFIIRIGGCMVNPRRSLLGLAATHHPPGMPA